MAGLFTGLTGGTGALGGTADIVAFLGVGGYNDFKKALTDAGTQTDSLTGKINKGLNVAIAAGGAAFTAMVLSASAFETKMANIETLIVNEGKPAIDGLTTGLLEMTTEIPKSATALSDAMYQVVSATVPAADRLDVLEVAAKGAIGGVADTASTFNLLSAAIKGYGREWSDAGEISDIVFKTIEQGQTTMAELATSMQGTIPLASTLGIAFEEIAGATATLTGVTGNTSEVMTQIESIMTALIKETSGMKGAFQDLGVASGQELIDKMDGLGGALQALKGYSEKYNISIGEILGRKEALVAYYSLTGAQAKDFTEKTEMMYKATGAANAAFEVQMDTLQNQAILFKNIIQKSLIEDGLNTLIPALTDTLKSMNKQPEAIQATVSSLSALALTAGGVAGVIKGGMGIASLISFIGPWGVAIAAVTAAYVALHSIATQRLQDQLEEIDQTDKQVQTTLDLEKKFQALYEKENRTKEEQQALFDTVDALELQYASLGIEVSKASDEFGYLNEKIVQQKLLEKAEELQEVEKQMAALQSQTARSVTAQGEFSNGWIAMGANMSSVARDAIGGENSKDGLLAKQAALNKEIQDLTNLILNPGGAKEAAKDLGSEIKTTADYTGRWALGVNDLHGTLEKGTKSLLDHIEKELDWNKNINMTSEGIAVLNTRMPELTEYTKDLYEEISHNIDVGVEFGDMLNLWIDQAGGVVNIFQDIGNSTGILDDTANKAIGSLQKIITSGFNPVVIGMEAVNLVFGDHKKVIDITEEDIQELIKSYDSLGWGISETQAALENFNGSFESDTVTELQDQLNTGIEALAELKAVYDKMPDSAKESMDGQIAEWEKFVKETQDQIDGLLGAFSGLYDFEDQTDALNALADEAIRAFDKMGASIDYSGAISLIKEQITASETLLETLDPQSQAYEELSMAIAEANGAIAVMNGEFETVNDYLIANGYITEEVTEVIEEQTEVIEEQTEVIEEQVQVVKDLRATWEKFIDGSNSKFKTMTGNINTLNSAFSDITFFGGDIQDFESGSFDQMIADIYDYYSGLEQGSQAQKEFADSMLPMIEAFVSAGGEINDLPRGLQQLYRNYTQVEPVIESVTQTLFEQITGFKDLADVMGEPFAAMNAQYSEFTTLAGQANELFDNVEFFGLDFMGSDAQQAMDAIILQMIDYLNTLNPNSEAYSQYSAELNSLIERYQQLFGWTEAVKDETGKVTEEFGSEKEEIQAINDIIKAMTDDIDDLTSERDAKVIRLEVEIPAEIEALEQQIIDIQDQVQDRTDQHEAIVIRIRGELEAAEGTNRELEGLLDILKTGSLEELMANGLDLYTLDELLESISGNTHDFNIEWEAMIGNMVGDFGTFTGDMEEALGILEQLEYFKIDLDTTTADEQIGALILKMEAYLATLDPNSQAYQDFKDQLDDLKERFGDIGGEIDTEWTLNWKEEEVKGEMTELDTFIQDLIDQLGLENLDFEADITNLNQLTTEINTKISELEQEKIDLTVEITGMNAMIQDLKDRIEELEKILKLKIPVEYVETGKSPTDLLYHTGGVIGSLPRLHSGGLLSDEIPAILQRGETVLPKSFLQNYGTARVNNFIDTLDPSVLSGSKNESGSMGITVIIKEPGPNTTAELVDQTVLPRITNAQRHFTITDQLFRED